MWLITHAAGTIGRAVARAAADRGHSLRLQLPSARRDAWIPADAETVVADYSDPAALSALFEGIERAVLLAPLGPEVPDRHAALATAAHDHRVRQVVQVTAQGSDPASPMRIFRWMGEAEARVKAAGVHAHIVRPALCMQVMLKSTPAICTCGTIEAPFRAARWPLVDARDVGEVVVKLLEEGGRPSVHELTGPQALDYFEIARIASKVLGRKIQYVDVCAPKARGKLEARQLPPRLIDGLLEFWDYAASGVIAPRVTDDIEKVLGRPPRRFADFVREEMQPRARAG